MFIKINPSKNFKYVQLVESYRKGDKAKHRVLFNLGRLDQIENNPEFQKVFKKLAELAGAKSLSIEKSSDAQLFNWGYCVYKKLWKKFQLDHALPQWQKQSSKSYFPFEAACFLMVIQHLLSPMSKLGSYQHQDHYLHLKPVKLHHLYRSLDLLSEGKEFIEAHLFQMNRSLFNMRVDVVFYDVTTFHFESVEQDSLRDFGYSKNAKFNEAQVVLGMLIDGEGRPVGYELFPGNTFEGHTLEVALDAIEKRFAIRRIIIVADRGLNSKLNLKSIKDKGYGYIVSSRIKNLPAKQQESIFDTDGYQTLREEKEDKVTYKILDHTNIVKIPKENAAEARKKRRSFEIIELSEKLIITHSTKRAKKDKADRERLINKAKNLLQDKAKIVSSNRRNGKKYIQPTEETDWALDQEAVKRDEMWDGYYGIQTSESSLSAQEVLEAYHTLWKIEESFRVMKSTLEVRPVFHWTESRIKGHFVSCFMAFLLERTLEIQLKEAKIDASPLRIREALNSMQFAKVDLEGEAFLIKTKQDELASKILRKFRIAPPKNVTPEAAFSI